MREYYYLTGLDESPYQLTLLDALHLGATEHLGAYVLATHDITLKNPGTGAEEPGKGLHLKLCASTLQQIEKDTSKAEHQPPPGRVSERPRLSQCYGAHEALINHARFGIQTNESADTLKSDRLVLLHYPNGDPFIFCVSDLLFWADDLERMAENGEIKRRDNGERQDHSPQLEELPNDFSALYNAMGAAELPHMDTLITAWRRFWKGRGPNDGKPYPRNDEVAEWVKEQMDIPSTVLAKNMAKIIRPSWAPTGRQPNRNQ